MRLLAVARRVAAAELLGNRWIGKREPRALQALEAECRRRDVEPLKADELGRRRRDAVCRKQIGDERQRARGARGEKHRVGPARLHLPRDLRRGVGHALLGERKRRLAREPRAARPDRPRDRRAPDLLGGLLPVDDEDVVAALPGGEADEPVGGVAKRRAEHVDVAAGDRRIVGKRQDVQPVVAHRDARGGGGLGENRSEDDVRTVVGRPLRGVGGERGLPRGVVDPKRDRHAPEVVDCQTGGILETPRKDRAALGRTRRNQ